MKLSRFSCSVNVFREQERALTQAGMSPIQPQLRPDQPRFIGGGFNLKQITAKTAA